MIRAFVSAGAATLRKPRASGDDPPYMVWAGWVML